MLTRRQDAGSTLQFRRILQRFYRFCPVGFGVVPRVVKLEENPLRPFEIVRVGRVHLAAPIVAESKRLNLALERGDVLLGGLARVLAVLDGVLLGRQAECVPAHRVQHVKALCAAVSRQNVGSGVAFRVTDVQTFAGRVGEHVEDVEFRRQLLGARRFSLETVPFRKRVSVRNCVARIPGAEGLLIVPYFLPFRLDQMERILSAAARHKGGILRKVAGQGNGEFGQTVGRTDWIRTLKPVAADVSPDEAMPQQSA